MAKAAGPGIFRCVLHRFRNACRIFGRRVRVGKRSILLQAAINLVSERCKSLAHNPATFMAVERHVKDNRENIVVKFSRIVNGQGNVDAIYVQAHGRAICGTRNALVFNLGGRRNAGSTHEAFVGAAVKRTCTGSATFHLGGLDAHDTQISFERHGSVLAAFTAVHAEELVKNEVHHRFVFERTDCINKFGSGLDRASQVGANHTDRAVENSCKRLAVKRKRCAVPSLVAILVNPRLEEIGINGSKRVVEYLGIAGFACHDKFRQEVNLVAVQLADIAEQLIEVAEAKLSKAVNLFRCDFDRIGSAITTRQVIVDVYRAGQAFRSAGNTVRRVGVCLGDNLSPDTCPHDRLERLVTNSASQLRLACKLGLRLGNLRAVSLGNLTQNFIRFPRSGVRMRLGARDQGIDDALANLTEKVHQPRVVIGVVGNLLVRICCVRTRG